MIIHLSFIRNTWISATLSATVTLPFTYQHILTLLTNNSLLSMMIASLSLVIQLSLTYPHVPDEAQMINHQASYLASIHLIFVFSCDGRQEGGCMFPKKWGDIKNKGQK